MTTEEKLIEQLSETKVRIRQEVLNSQEGDRRSKRVTVPHTKDYIAQRAEFVKQWNKLTDKGLKNGYLEWTNDYEGSHIEPTTELASGPYTQYTETEEDWAARVDAIVEKRFRKFKAKMQKALS